MRRVLTAIFAVMVLAGCGADKPLVQFVNTPPQAHLSADPAVLAISDTAIVTCEVTDPDPDVFTYRWTSRTGRFIHVGPGMSQVSWIAPQTAGFDTIHVTVFDQTDSVSAWVRIEVLGQTGVVQGLVKDESTSAGLVGAHLELAGRTAISGTGGAFRLELVPPGVDTLHATLDGYDPFDLVMAVREGTNDLDVSMRQAVPKAPFHGTLTDTNQAPVPGASCRVGNIEVSSDVDGRYDFPGVPLGRQQLLIQAAGYETVRDTVDIQVPGVQKDVVLHAAAPLQPQGQLLVTKLDNLRLRVDWTPENVPPTINGYALTMIVSDENQGLPQPVPGGPLPRGGGSREIEGTIDRHYRVAVAGVNAEGVTGPNSAYSPVRVLTPPSPVVRVPAGPTILGSYPDGYGSELHPGNPVNVTSFALEESEVTNRQYVAFLVELYAEGVLQVTTTEVRRGTDLLLTFAASQVDIDPVGDGFSVRPELKDYPVCGVSWYGARAYAQWCGRRLPREAEWEKAARGHADSTAIYPQSTVHVGTIYPWGNTPPTVQRTNFNRLLGGKRPVKSFPTGAARWWEAPIYDLAGNAWEWCDDWFAPYTNPHQPPASGSFKVVRGGAWDSVAPEIRVGYRWYLEPTLVSAKIGFRCATD